MEKIVEELKSLSAIPAVSGSEDKILNVIKSRLEPIANEITIDRVGNLTVTFHGKSQDEPSILVFAHVDEVGMIVRKIEENGFIRIERIGGVNEKTLLGTHVDVHSVYDDSFVTGFFGTSSHHLTLPEEKYTVPSRYDMYIDIGLSSREEVLSKGIDIGSLITYHPNFLRIGEHKITSKTLDNRIGVYMLLQLADHLVSNPPKGTVHLVFSVQEEFNVRGVLPVFEKIRPHASICLDITPACDTPDHYKLYEISLGKGPAITHMNTYGKGPIGGLVPNPKFRRFIEKTAEQLNLAFQREVISGVITDDAFAVLSGSEGVAMAHLSIPVRYTHTPFETADVRDIQNGSILLNEVVTRFGKDVNIQRGI